MNSTKRGWDITKRISRKAEQQPILATKIYVDSSGRKGIGETPQEAHQPPAESVVYFRSGV
ncbi:hypothetical protein FN924_15150 [Radiobacillus deserti]|uniref:Uncharacterized protein n=1 Tax=Radiobacillus deserti TaxID=2594883 RepID=A0A516KJ48_9BACI|nr:hypothetical protein FN924_15150 [Radiobacillus deserti]